MCCSVLFDFFFTFQCDKVLLHNGVIVGCSGVVSVIQPTLQWHRISSVGCQNARRRN